MWSLTDSKGRDLAIMERLHPHGVFAARPCHRGCATTDYAYRARTKDKPTTRKTRIASRPRLGDVDLYLLGEGKHQQVYSALGAHYLTFSGIKGTRFAVWAPNATRVSVVGDFNTWDGQAARYAPAPR